MKQSQLSATSAVKPTTPLLASSATISQFTERPLHRSPCKQNVERVLAPSSYQQSNRRRKQQSHGFLVGHPVQHCSFDGVRTTLACLPRLTRPRTKKTEAHLATGIETILIRRSTRSDDQNLHHVHAGISRTHPSGWRAADHASCLIVVEACCEQHIVRRLHDADFFLQNLICFHHVPFAAAISPSSHTWLQICRSLRLLSLSKSCLRLFALSTATLAEVSSDERELAKGSDASTFSPRIRVG
ncbi:hypothetical protein KC342_g56 [Hortaea werneckii]|nr:hypothetical protein KC342_g56 [Hortaea werneckii]